MAFERPTLSKLVRRIRSDIATKLAGADANLRLAFESVIAIALAGLTHGLHGHLKWLSKQLIADLAEDEFLLRIASIYGYEQTAATAAAGQITITGTNGNTAPAGTVWSRGDGVLYTQDADATISSGTATADVTATSDYLGTQGNADASSKLTIGAPVSGIGSTATVSGDGITDGTDLETVEHLRTRLLLRLRNPPKGGGPGDYVNWALEVAGVTRAWEYAALLGPGTVGVRFVCDDQEGSIIPDSGKVSDVQDHLDSARPITADVTAIAPDAVDLDLTISVTPDTTAIRDAVEASLIDFLRRTSEPGVTIYLSQINEAISTSSGETDHTLSSPVADTTYGDNEIPVLGTITWV